MNEGLPDQFVVIKTIYPLWDLNYGNLLQAWALRQHLFRLGHESVVDSTPALPTRVAARVRYRDLATRFASTLPRRLLPAAIRRLQTIDRATLLQRAFREEHLPAVSIVDKLGQIDRRILSRTSAFVIGSDQVWRPKYVDPAAMLLAPLARDFAGAKFSYAASFGRADLAEWTPKAKEVTRALALNLNGISVREYTGIEVAKRLWGVDAIHHVDPVLLLSRADYGDLAMGAPSLVPEGGLVEYVLDRTPGSVECVESVARNLGTKATTLLPDSSIREHVVGTSRYEQLRPSVESWVSTLLHAGFVVTDSYHGAVFSILFNVPFMVLVNHERGATRFESLLTLFGLENRSLKANQRPEDILQERIDWNRVNSGIERERARATGYLMEMLPPRTTTKAFSRLAGAGLF